MLRTQKYKNIERTFVATMTGGVKAFFSAVGVTLRAFFRLFTHKLTIMIVPHTQEKVISFQTNVVAVVVGILVIMAVIFSFFYYNRRTVYSSVEIASLVNENKAMTASLNELRNENANLLATAKKFRTSLNGSLETLGLVSNTENENTYSTGGLASLFDIGNAINTTTKEISDIQALNTFLGTSIQPIEQVGKMLENQNFLFKEIPNICPVKSNNLHISMTFGPNVHPISGQWYIHKGVDFSTFRTGDIVMATANGQVVSCGYDPIFGNSVVIRHKHGIYTRFAHLARFIIKKGDYVTQGQTIGYVGNTGVTTGAHLHYEVHIGSDVVDPMKYVNIKLSVR